MFLFCCFALFESYEQFWNPFLDKHFFSIGKTYFWSECKANSDNNREWNLWWELIVNNYVSATESISASAWQFYNASLFWHIVNKRRQFLKTVLHILPWRLNKLVWNILVDGTEFMPKSLLKQHTLLQEGSVTNKTFLTSSNFLLKVEREIVWNVGAFLTKLLKPLEMV